MKKTLILLIAATLLLSACTSMAQAGGQHSIDDIYKSVNATLTAMPADVQQTTANPNTQPTAQPTALPTQAATSAPAANTPAPTATTLTTNASAGIDNLNLRLGPGFSYAVSQLLAQGQALDVLGRSNDGLWLEVLLLDGSGGWVFASYIITDLTIASLPVKEASGGPYPQVTPVPVESITMSISGTQAVVKVNRFPVSTDIVAKLGLPGQGADLELAKGATDANGQATLTFSMPTHWSDGSALIQTNLVLLVSTQSGSFSQSADILFIH